MSQQMFVLFSTYLRRQQIIVINNNNNGDDDDDGINNNDTSVGETMKQLTTDIYLD